MSRKSFRSSSTNVLKGHGYVTANAPGDISQDESDDFDLTPGAWQWNGSAWVAYSPPPLTNAEKEAIAEVRLDAELLLKALVLVVRTEINTIRAALPTPLPALSIADWRDKVKIAYRGLV